METLEEQKDNITIEQIYTILNNYRIGKKPLAKLLGWGETTIIRYVEGDSPTNEYSDKLRMILENPGYFYEILTRNKANITQVAYKKCSKAVLKQMLQSRISVISQYVINKRSGQISLLELETYLYYIQAFHLALYNRPLFEDDYIINDSQMPYERVYQDYMTRKMQVLALEEDILTRPEKEFIDYVLQAFDWYGPAMLKSLVGYEKVMLRISRDSMNRKIINKETIKMHFIDVITLYKINSEEDIHNYPDQRFMEIKELQ
ncbi:MAG: hypothetical protein Q4F05_18210 [bacterium]|nr:hypothetical protein [bacterium]